MKDNAEKDAREAPMAMLLHGAQEAPNGNLVSERSGAAEARRMKEMPVKGTKGKEEIWAKLGFEFGEPGADGDELFRPVKKHPEGWKLDSDREDARHMKLYDDKGRERATMFYKNAFYDRKADISLVRRLVVDGGYMLHKGFTSEDRRQFVWDRAHSVYDSHYAVLFMFDEPRLEDETDWQYKDRGREACAAFLQEFYPESDDPTAYWEDELEGVTRIEVEPE